MYCSHDMPCTTCSACAAGGPVPTCTADSLLPGTAFVPQTRRALYDMFSLYCEEAQQPGQFRSDLRRIIAQGEATRSGHALSCAVPPQQGGGRAACVRSALPCQRCGRYCCTGEAAVQISVRPNPAQLPSPPHCPSLLPLPPCSQGTHQGCGCQPADGNRHCGLIRWV